MHSYTIRGYAQGTTFGITYYATDSIITKHSVDSTLAMIDSSLSLYNPYSLICRFNNAEAGILTDSHMRKVITKSMDVFRKTAGIFDITVKPLVAAWGFGIEPVSAFPSPATIDALMNCVGSDKIRLTSDSLLKEKPCINIDVNGIAQGYSVDVLATLLEKKQVKNYIIELGGEIRVAGKRQENGETFRIGIEAPSANPFSEPAIRKRITIPYGAITTSGSYRKFHESGSRKVSHLIDARTGYPVDNELISTTVWSNDAITADGYDNALMAMGLKQAIAFVNGCHDMEAYFIYKKADGSISDTATAGFYKFLIH